MRRFNAIVVLLILAMAGCSTSSDPSATYTGGACTYDGPTEFELDSEVTFTFIDETESESTGFAVWTVPDGTTADQIHEDGIFSLESEGGRHIGWSSETQVSDSEWQLTATFSESGLYVLNCFDTAGGEHGGAGLDYSTMVTVAE